MSFTENIILFPYISCVRTRSTSVQVIKILSIIFHHRLHREQYLENMVGVIN